MRLKYSSEIVQLLEAFFPPGRRGAVHIRRAATLPRDVAVVIVLRLYWGRVRYCGIFVSHARSTTCTSFGRMRRTVTLLAGGRSLWQKAAEK